MNKIYLLFVIRSSLEDFLRNKVRTVLTSLGIMIGIFSVVMLLALGLGLQQYISDQFKSLGANLIMVTPGKVLFGGGGSGALTESPKFDLKDINGIKRIRNLSLAVGIFVKFNRTQGTRDTRNLEMLAASPDIFPLLNFKVDKGRLFDKTDDAKGSKVMVMGSKAAENLFGSKEDALGKTAKLENQGYKVIGVLAPKGGSIESLDDRIFIPSNSSASFNPAKKFWAIYGRMRDESRITETKNEIKNILLKRYHEDDFSVSDQRELLKTFDTIFTMINLILVAIAAISLVVGGIGVMNIMYVSVIERVREIGIRRAFGARKKDILVFFLAESVILSTIGGILGLGASYLTVWVIQYLFPAYINLVSVILAVGVSSMIGIIFGVFPARRAANLTPIDAIRFE